MASCASVSLQMLGDPRPGISGSQVTEYDAIPAGAQKFAKVTVSLASYYGGVEVKWEVKKKAAALGANGYKLLSLEKSETGFGSPGMSGSNYTGEAIVFYVPDK